MRSLNKILLIDDDEATNVLSRVLLKKLQAAKEILVAGDGLIACELIKESGCPDIIFLDIRMPRMDGFEFLAYIQKMDICKNAKIVMLSSSVLQEDKERAFTYAQVVDYQEKPITKEMIERVTREFYSDKE